MCESLKKQLKGFYTCLPVSKKFKYVVVIFVCVLIFVRVSTNSDKPGVEKRSEEQYKVRVKAKPFGGKANEEVIRRLTEYFSVPLENARIIRGHTSQKKSVEIVI